MSNLGTNRDDDRLHIQQHHSTRIFELFRRNATSNDARFCSCINNRIDENTIMCKFLKWLISSWVLGIVLCGVVDAGCRQAVVNGILDGLIVGLVHGIMHVYCIREGPSGRKLTVLRVRKILIHDLRMDAAIGLLIGAVGAVVSLCGK